MNDVHKSTPYLASTPNRVFPLSSQKGVDLQIFMFRVPTAGDQIASELWRAELIDSAVRRQLSMR